MLSHGFAFACSFALVFLGCSGVSPTPLPANGSAHCSGICARATTCGLLPSGAGTACTDACASELESVGSIGETVASACEACLDAESCSSITAGGCGSACPSGVFYGGGGGGGGGGSSGGGTCTQSWTGGVQYSVHCEWSTSDYYCRCYENGVESEIFDSLDFCSVDRASQTTRADSGCGWAL